MEQSEELNIVGPALPPHLKERMSQIGPTLPPHLSNKLESLEESSGKECSNIGPQLPPHLQKRVSESSTDDEPNIGPQLPPYLQNKCGSSKEDISISSQLPPQMVEKPLEENSGTYGPQLPPHLLKKLSTNSSSQSKDIVSKTIGPQLPPHLRKKLEIEAENTIAPEIEEDTYGPLPAGSSTITAAEIALEERAIQMQIDKLAPQSTDPVREEWMTELPEARARSLGLGPRQFRKNAAPDMSDRSSWTTIAGEKPIKENKKDNIEDLRVEAEQKQLEKRDKEQALEAKKHKRKSKSLVDMHQEKLKKKDGGLSSTERRPFSRDVDLQVNKFDDAQKKAIMKKAQLLDDRFSSGKSKFL